MPQHGGFQHGQQPPPAQYGAEQSYYGQQPAQYGQEVQQRDQYSSVPAGQPYPGQGPYGNAPSDGAYGNPNYDPAGVPDGASGDRGILGAVGGGLLGSYGGKKMGGHGLIGSVSFCHGIIQM